ncbi:MAG: hypothetical protein DRP64_04070 [Verrucomicrobia bacterium]|nr:MAG: hypothetical protein DRP64_04070 [Verrucomicrobiota bacterium]
MMEKVLIIAAAFATGLAVHAQTLVLSDSFDSGLAFATNDLNYNLAGRQAGTSAPLDWHIFNTNLATLSASGELHLVDVGVPRTDPFSPQIGNESFSIKVKGRHLYTATADWTMLSVQSATNDNWELSPININLWNTGIIEIYSGSYTGIGSTNISVSGVTSNAVATAIGGPYNVSEMHTFEIRTIAQSATNGTFGFYVDDAVVASGLAYTFGDANLQFAWVPNASALPETKWDDLEVSTIPTPEPPPPPPVGAEEDLILFRGGAWFGNISSNGFGDLSETTAMPSPGFGAPHASTTPAAGDINGDGFDDMVVIQDAENDGIGAWGWHAAYTVDTDADDVGEMSLSDGSAFAWAPVANTRYVGLADITGDGMQDAIYVTTNFVWFATPSTTNGFGTGVTQGNIGYGTTTLNDIPILGDFNGDGMDDFGVWRQASGGTHLQLTGGTVGSGVMGTGGTVGGSFGNAAWDYPLIGDINGDGRDDLVIVEDDTEANLLWQVAYGQADGKLDSSVSGNLVRFGQTNDVPMLADVNGDGRDDLVIVRNETQFYAAFTDASGLLTADTDSTLSWGTTGDIPLFGQLNLITYAAPEIGSIVMNLVSAGLELTWTTGPGHDYLLQNKANLTDLSWASNATYMATGASMTVTTAVDQAKSFYRVIVE